MLWIGNFSVLLCYGRGKYSNVFTWREEAPHMLNCITRRLPNDGEGAKSKTSDPFTTSPRRTQRNGPRAETYVVVPGRRVAC